jgi:hypothetical protein
MKDRLLNARRRRRAGVLFIIVIALVAILQAGAARRAYAQQSSSSQTNPKTQSSSQSGSSSQSSGQGMGNMQGMQGMSGMDHGQMNMSQEGQANSQMAMHSHQHMGPHMHMTTKRAASAEDWAKADEIADTLRNAIEKYKDYRVAMADGFRVFLPNVPQPMYHFTSSDNAIIESFTFDPARPTSLLYKKTASGYELIGAMFTMPKSATEEQLNERIPLGVAQWHLHTNLCMPARGTQFDMTKYGLTGSIVTKDACDATGGRFIPVLFGWMVHVYPYEGTREKIWEQ